MLTARALLAVNVAFYAYLLWLCIVFFRTAQGKERILVAGCFPGILLTPLQSLVSTTTATSIRYIEAASIAVAFVAAVWIMLEGTGREFPPSDSGVLR